MRGPAELGRDEVPNPHLGDFVCVSGMWYAPGPGDLPRSFSDCHLRAMLTFGPFCHVGGSPYEPGPGVSTAPEFCAWRLHMDAPRLRVVAVGSTGV
jgi:hypothetical protein